jgi:hypothetical protein
MREIIYKFEDGTETRSFAIAQECGMPYRTEIRAIAPPRKTLSEKRKEAIRKKFAKR